MYCYPYLELANKFNSILIHYRPISVPPLSRIQSLVCLCLFLCYPLSLCVSLSISLEICVTFAENQSINNICI